ncbi:MAG: PAS domain S-box protein, partial [Ferrovum sp.]|nr:PAS domain S-box protein [Ferrovum sp.]
MSDEFHILIVEDNEADFALIERALRRAEKRCLCRRVQGRQELEVALEEREWDAILSDYHVPGLLFEDTLSLIASRWQETPIILVSGEIGEEKAVELLKRGVWDFVLKDNMIRLVSVLERGLREAEESRLLKRTEQALRESLERDYDLVENSQDFICTHDLEGNLLSVNAAAERMTGYPKEMLLGRNLADLITRQGHAGLAAYLNEIRTTGVAHGQMCIRTASGKACWLEFNNTLRTEGVPVPVVRGMAHDITGRRAAEAKIKQLTH